MQFKVRILHVLDHSLPVQTGYSFRTRSILVEQRARGWQTFQVTSSKHPQPGPDPETIDGLRFYRSAVRAPWLARLPALDQYEVIRGLTYRLHGLVSSLKPTILHAHSPTLNGLAAIKVGHARGLPVVYECRAFWEDAAVDHGTTEEGSLRYRLTQFLETQVFRRADAVTCICQGLKDEIQMRGIPEDKITVIPNGVDSKAFGATVDRNTGLAKRLGIEKGPILGFIGSFYRYEGLDLAIDALDLIRRTFPTTRLLLVGGGFQEKNLKAQVERKGLQSAVIFAGRVPHAEIQDYYDLVDILLYPRYAKRITELVTPLKPLEAMAQRRLIVASDVGGHRELIREGQTGRLFRAGDVTALAETVIDLLAHPGDWVRYRRSGRAFVERERSWTDSVARYAPVYYALVGKG